MVPVLSESQTTSRPSRERPCPESEAAARWADVSVPWRDGLEVSAHIDGAVAILRGSRFKLSSRLQPAGVQPTRPPTDRAADTINRQFSSPRTRNATFISVTDDSVTQPGVEPAACW